MTVNVELETKAIGVLGWFYAIPTTSMIRREMILTDNVCFKNEKNHRAKLYGVTTKRLNEQVRRNLRPLKNQLRKESIYHMYLLSRELQCSPLYCKAKMPLT